ncbi:MAG TPA: phosphate ABC transporter ATP-binding protein [Kouleothrix sp.]|jgi:phosphate transport system ATP-binding protein|nr:phosphate ABC transporter ATP-binding protein [Kouleothrix sp.]
MDIKIEFDHYTLAYGRDVVLNDITLPVARNAVLAVFGPAGSGKSGFLRSINRMAELESNERHQGDIRMDGVSIFAPAVRLPELRRRAAMVFAQPVALPMSIYDNVSYGLRLAGQRDRRTLDAAVERALRASTLWDEVKDRLDSPGLNLSGGQQQRLSIARALALEPEVLLLDAPTAALDPISTAKIEDMLIDLKANYTIVIVPHSIQQAARVGDAAAFFLNGTCVEYGAGNQLFVSPRDKRTEDYVTGRFG